MPETKWVAVAAQRGFQHWGLYEGEKLIGHFSWKPHRIEFWTEASARVELVRKRTTVDEAKTHLLTLIGGSS
jgi:hypothetical protein